MMPLALADDLSGAAEIAGIAWRYGREASVCLRPEALAGPDTLNVLDLDSRCIPSAEAAERLRAALRRGPTPPTLDFLKTDSVLRGNPGAEIEAALAATGLRRALLLAGNPDSRRLQNEGRLWVEGRPLAKSAFSRDPIHPARHSDIGRILSESGAQGPTHFLEPDAPLPARGILIGRLRSRQDLEHWAERLDAKTLPGGGGAFFAALLACRYPLRDVADEDLTPPPPEGGVLYVCGSAHEASARQVAAAREAGLVLHYLEAGTALGQDEAIAGASRTLLDGLQAGGRALLAVRPGGAAGPDAATAERLRETMAHIVECTVAVCSVARLCIEGGATARCLLERIGVERLHVEREWAQGVVALRPDKKTGPSMVLKPGSYPWPESLAIHDTCPGNKPGP